MANHRASRELDRRGDELLKHFESKEGKLILDEDLLRYSLWVPSHHDAVKNGLREVLDFSSVQKSLTATELNNPGKTFNVSKYSTLSQEEKTRLKKLYDTGTNKKSNFTDAEHDLAVKLIQFMGTEFGITLEDLKNHISKEALKSYAGLTIALLQHHLKRHMKLVEFSVLAAKDLATAFITHPEPKNKSAYRVAFAGDIEKGECVIFINAIGTVRRLSFFFFSSSLFFFSSISFSEFQSLKSQVQTIRLKLNIVSKYCDQ